MVQNGDLTGFKDDEEGTFVWIVAGEGEIHLGTDEGCWWLAWDRTHAVDKEKELTEPVTDDPAVMARWLFEQVPLFEEAVWNPFK